MRGKVCVVVPVGVVTGITPAYAGKSLVFRLIIPFLRDHPRLCGEKRTLFSRLFHVSGSPPPMRGKAKRAMTSLQKSGITPAYAGKSVDGISHIYGVQDHPRLCGEKRHLMQAQCLTQGSPPPMRGKVAGTRSVGFKVRITPAYAGKRLSASAFAVRIEDHPRLCGEKVNFAHFCTSAAGSPPPMRGKAVHYTGGSIECRITPAYAGKSFSLRRRGHEMWDHPRLCGEKDRSKVLLNGESGSPPPMRGKGCRLFAVYRRMGITPAYAGKSTIKNTGDAECGDHPRLCGEKVTVWKPAM